MGLEVVASCGDIPLFFLSVGVSSLASLRISRERVSPLIFIFNYFVIRTVHFSLSRWTWGPKRCCFHISCARDPGIFGV